MNSALAVLIATIPVLGAVYVSRRGNKRDMASIELKVNGRLEAALQRIDNLEADKAAATGHPAPPLVSGLGVPVPVVAVVTPAEPALPEPPPRKKPVKRTPKKGT